MRLPLIIAAWLFLVAIPARGQSAGPVLAGRVVDRETGEPVAGAAVTVPGSDHRRMETDATGRFRLPAVADTIALRVWRLDYAALDTVIELAAAEEELLLSLVRLPIRLRGLTVYAGPEGAAQAERALFELEVIPGVIGISRREIRELPGLAEPDLLRSLQALPGVVALNDLSAQLHVWGGAPDQNLFLLDGARIFAPYHMFGLFGAFNTDAVERVEFFRNVIPARRGGALSAAIELEQRAGSESGVRVDGGLGLLGAQLTARGPLPWTDGGWMIAAKRTHADAVVDLFGGDFPYAFHDVHGRLAFAPAPEHRIRFSGFTSADRFRMFLHSIDDDLRSRWRNAAGSARWEWQRGGRSASVEAWGSLYRGTLTIGGGAGSPTTRNRLGATGLRLEAVRRGEESGVRVGVEVEGGRSAVLGADRAGGYIVGNATERYLLPAAFVEAEERLGPVRLAPGVRAVYAARRGQLLLEPRVSARLYLGRDLALTVGAGRSHQLLSTIRDDRYPVPGAPFWFVHPPRQPVSRADGLSAELEGWLRRAWQFRASAYARAFESVARWRPVGSRDLSRLASDDGQAAGVEASVRRHEGVWTGWLAYGLARVRLTETETGRGYYAAWDRRHALDVALFYRPRPALTLSARLAYGSGLPFWPPAGENDAQRFDPIQGRIQLGERYPVWAGEQERFPAYFRADAGTRYRWSIGRAVVEPYLSVVNLTGRENVLYYTLLPPRTLETASQQADRPLLEPELQLPLPLFPSLGVEVRF